VGSLRLAKHTALFLPISHWSHCTELRPIGFILEKYSALERGSQVVEARKQTCKIGQMPSFCAAWTPDLARWCASQFCASNMAQLRDTLL